MAFIKAPSVDQRSTFGRFSSWEISHIKWVATLTDRQVLKKLNDIMLGHHYSWYTISQRLQAKLNSKSLKLEHFEPGNILYEWNILCDEKISWHRHNRPSFKSFKFNRSCLVNLKIIPFQAGLGLEGKMWTKVNVDMMFVTNKLAIDYSRAAEGGLQKELRGANGYFYAEGPEFRLEYIHDRVEY